MIFIGNPEHATADGMNRPLFAGDPEVRILGYGQEEFWEEISGRVACTCCAHGLRSRERISKQVRRDFIGFAEGWMQPGQPAHPLTGRALHSNVPRGWVKQHETDSGLRGGETTAERDRIRELERENRQLRQANEILKLSLIHISEPTRPY